MVEVEMEVRVEVLKVVLLTDVVSIEVVDPLEVAGAEVAVLDDVEVTVEMEVVVPVEDVEVDPEVDLVVVPTPVDVM